MRERLYRHRFTCDFCGAETVHESETKKLKAWDWTSVYVALDRGGRECDRCPSCTDADVRKL